jgi:hypothetical protein
VTLKQKWSGLLKENSNDTVYSTSKLWFNIANVAIVTIYCMIGYNVSQSTEPNIEGMAWLTLVMAGVVTANKFATKFLGYKYRGNNPEETVSKKPPIKPTIKKPEEEL